MLAVPSTPIVTVRLGVRMADLDPRGVVHNVSYLYFVDQATIEAVHHVGVSSEEFSSVVHNNTIDYVRPLAAESVEVTTWVTRLGATYVTFAFHVHTGTVVHAHGHRTYVRIGAEGRPQRMPAVVRTALGTLLADG